MTTEDEHSEIARLYVERQEVQGRLACLANKSRRLEKTLPKKRRDEDGNIVLPPDFRSRYMIRSDTC